MALKALLIAAGLLSVQAYDLNLIKDNSTAEYRLTGYDRIEELKSHSNETSKILQEYEIKSTLHIKRNGSTILAKIKDFTVAKKENVVDKNLTDYFRDLQKSEVEKPFNFTILSYNSYRLDQPDQDQKIGRELKSLIANRFLLANEVINRYLIGNFTKEVLSEGSYFGICDISHEDVPIQNSKFYRAKSYITPTRCSNPNAFNSTWNKEEIIYEICRSDSALIKLSHNRDVFSEDDTRKQVTGLILDLTTSDPKNECKK